jgi:hypothetical protein
MWREDYIPWTDWEDAEWNLVTSDWEWLGDEDGFYEGESTIEIPIGGTSYKVHLKWEFYPDLVTVNPYNYAVSGLDDAIVLTYGQVEDGDVPIYDERDGETMSLDSAVDAMLNDFLTEFADEMFPIPYPQEPDVPSDYGPDDFRERRLHPHTPWNYGG